jgi:TonB-dependent receptor
MSFADRAARRARLFAAVSLGTLVFTAFAGAQPAQAQAQTAPAPEADQQAEERDDGVIRVRGFRQSIEEGLDGKKSANQVMDVITAEEFGKFPDQNIAESIQRVPGISMTRNNGEGDTITIRGLEPDLTRVEINGRSSQVVGNVESPGMASSLAIFGSDQFARIEVVKSPQAKDDEGGVGGIVRLLTARPLEIGEFAARASVQGRYNEWSDKVDPVVSGMVADVFAGGKFGVLLSASYDDRSRRVDQTRNQNGWMELIPAQTRNPAVSGLAGQIYSTHFDQQFRVGKLPRFNSDLTLQYQPTPEFELYLNGNVALEDRQETVGRAAINLKSGNPQAIEGSVNETGTVDRVLFRNALFTLQNRGFDRQTESYGLTANPKWDNGDWLLSGRIDYSDSNQVTHDRRIRHRSNRDAGYDFTADERSPVFLLPDLDLTDLESFNVDQNLMEYGKVVTTELAYQADVTRRVNGFFSEFSAGVKFRDSQVDKAEGPARGPTTYTFADAYSPFPIDDFFGDEGGPDFLRVWPYVDATTFVDTFGPSEADSEAAIDPALAYSVSNESVAGYAQASFDSNLAWARIRGNTGVRVVSDDFAGSGTEVISVGGDTVYTPVESSSSVTNVLPNLNVIVEPAWVGGVVFRFAAARVMTRPRFTQLNPTATVNDDDLTVSRGNPDLEPFLANQFDAGVEYYFGADGAGLLAASFFHKDIENFVEPYSDVGDYTFPGAAAPEQVLISSYRNGGEGSVTGIELVAQTTFDFLPAPFDGFGGIVNYTYLDSSRTLDTGVDVQIPGNSPHTLNATLFYEKGPFSIRASYNYRDTYLQEQFGPRDNAIYVDADGRIDLSASYTMDSGVSVNLNVANLTGENRYEYADQPDRAILYQLDGRIVTFGVGYTF